MTCVDCYSVIVAFPCHTYLGFQVCAPRSKLIIVIMDINFAFLILVGYVVVIPWFDYLYVEVINEL